MLALGRDFYDDMKRAQGDNALRRSLLVRVEIELNKTREQLRELKRVPWPDRDHTALMSLRSYSGRLQARRFQLEGRKQ